MTRVAMTIAGSDPSGGAGLQADLKTFHQHRVYGTSVVTLLTVQNTTSVDQVETLDADFVRAQLDAVLADIPPHAAKTGALGSVEIIEAVAARAVDFSFPLVVDPVMISKHGAPLMEPAAIQRMREMLLPRAFLVTPNLAEAQELAQMDVVDLESMAKAARVIAEFGVQHVLVKGGHLQGKAVDYLWTGGESLTLDGPRVDTSNTHGTGCVFSAAITARLARGETIIEAAKGAKAFITGAILSNPALGRGFGPVNLFVDEA